MTDYFHMNMEPREIGAISNLGLAHLGDAVYELLVRAWLSATGRVTAKGLHKAAVRYVAAPAQAEALRRILPHLKEEEQAVYRRGRNARVNTVPQSASLEEYHAATGLEALFGHLYLRGDLERINALFALIIQEENHAP